MWRFIRKVLNNPTHLALLCLAATLLVGLSANESAIVASVPEMTSLRPRQTFADAPTSNPFWIYIERLATRAVLAGFSCGGLKEPCDAQRRPYFRPTGQMTLGELAEAVSAMHRYPEAPRGQTFADVPPGTRHYRAIEQLGHRFILTGIAYGTPGLPCDAEHRPYLQQDQVVDRYTLAAVLAASQGDDREPTGQTFSDVRPGSFYYAAVQQLATAGIFVGYSCGGPDEPCDAYYLRYFRGLDPADRQQIAKALSVARGYSEFPGMPSGAPTQVPRATIVP